MDFQTPDAICCYMVGLLKNPIYDSILEPTPGRGNLVKAISTKAKHIIAPNDFFKVERFSKFDAVVMNPPFSPMDLGYKILFDCMMMTDEIVALMPWLVIINSKKRTELLMNFGLVSITHLPRSIFKGARVQCCVMHLQNGYKGSTVFNNYTKP